MKVGYDSTLDFGTLGAAGDFPNVIDFGEGAHVPRSAVDLFVGGPATGGATVTVSGGETEAASTATLGSRVFTADELNGKNPQVAVSAHKYRYVKATLAGTPGVDVQAILNPNTGLA